MITLKHTEQAKINETIESIFEEQDQHFFEHVPKRMEGEIAIGAYDEEGTLAGGIVARREYQNMHVALLAVKASYRGQDIGNQLLKEIEKIAKKTGIINLTLTTRSYQAVDFYKKAGFDLYATLEDMPMEGVTKYYFNKRVKKEQ